MLPISSRLSEAEIDMRTTDDIPPTGLCVAGSESPGECTTSGYINKKLSWTNASRKTAKLSIRCNVYVEL